MLLLGSLGYQFHSLVSRTTKVNQHVFLIVFDDFLKYSLKASLHLSSALTTLHLSLPVWAVSTGWALALVSDFENRF